MLVERPAALGVHRTEVPACVRGGASRVGPGVLHGAIDLMHMML